MLTHCLPHTGVHTYCTRKGTPFSSLASVPELAQHTIVQMEQVHGSDFAEVTTTASDPIPAVDALITTKPQLALAVKHADCLPILVYHPRGAIAAIHAGRRSTQQQITKKVLRYMTHQYALRGPVHLWFGPALCTNCHSINNYTDHYNLYRENRLQVEHVLGTERAMITTASFCTLHDHDHFHSYRGEGPGASMNWSLIALSN